ncbi:DNA-directed DNA polymerase I [Aeropyrum pernix]|uniref:DNA-directed DNA polymerase I n=1 Tax=Aeropyrum pernix TaxID=56636 RepID=UPI001FB458ED|nr:DNA-directed DNA polymerase I [Aeropyrum pernix]
MKGGQEAAQDKETSLDSDEERGGRGLRQTTLLDYMAGSAKPKKPEPPPTLHREKGPESKYQNTLPETIGKEPASLSLRRKQPSSKHEEYNSEFGDVRGLALEPRLQSELSDEDVILELVREPWVESVRGYLLDVRYDGSLGKAVLMLYDPSSGSLVKWADRTGHKPYFLTDARPEDLRAAGVDVSRDESFLQYDLVEKFHPIDRKLVKLTKIVVSDPLAVRRLREKVSSAGFSVWEADIKYHHNYIFDRQLIPGILYEVSGARIVHTLPLEMDDATRVVDEIFRDEPREVRERAREWLRIFEAPPPKLPLIAFDIEVYSPIATRLPDPSTAPYPVISAATADSSGRSRVVLLYRDGVEFTEGALPEGTEVEIYDSERAMLLDLVRILQRYPLVVSFNGDNFDLPYIARRLEVLGVPREFAPIELKQDYATFRRTLHIDLHKLFGIRALQVYAFGNKYRELSLESISRALLGKGKVELKVPVSELNLNKLIEYNLQDARLTLELLTFSNNLVFNLIIMVMRTSKLGIEDITRSQISNWIRGLMYWEHRRRRWLIPSRGEIEKLSSAGARVGAIIKDKKYRGAIVLDPPVGIFFRVLVLDFASLYPSLIKQWNLSYETVNNPNCRDTIEVPEVGHKVCREFKGISNEIVGMLRDFRVRLYKKKSKDKSLREEERLWYDVVQSAMKVYINASYGVFGSENFSLYSLPVAESVTALGRAVLRGTLEKSRELNLHIVYGDTDSLFIWDPPKDVLDDLVDYVERTYGLELELDKVFRAILFSGLKKNYLGITEEGDIVIKGMVAKKSNTPEFIKDEFSKAVKILSKLQKPEDVEAILAELRDHINTVYNNVKKKVYTLDQFAIKVMLSKNPREYDKNTPQHVKAAMLLQRLGLTLSRGDIVYYVKTRDKLGVKPVQLARLSDVDPGKYVEHVKTAFEQMLMAFGISWDDISGVRKLDRLLFDS